MELDTKKYNYEELTKGITGSSDIEQKKKIIYNFGQYQITVEVTSTNEFIGITEVKINKDFLSYKQKTTPQGFHDVERFYLE